MNRPLAQAALGTAIALLLAGPPSGPGSGLVPAAAQAQPAIVDPPDRGASRFVGVVTDLSDGSPIAGARVGAGAAFAVTGEDGRYAVNVPPGRYDVRVTAVGYDGATIVGRSTGVVVSRHDRRILPDVGDSVTVDVGLPPLEADDAAIRAAARRLRAMAVDGPADAERTSMHPRPPSAVAASAAEPEPVPRDVRILMPDGTIVQVEMDEYLKGVVPVEMGYVFRRAFEALKAQAIASRTYASTSCLPASAGDPTRCERGLDANVDTTTRTQAWGPVHYDVTDAAVASTRGQVARLDGRIIQSLFFARTVGRTLDSEASPCCGGRVWSYMRSTWSPDPFDARRGHGAGMSQEGAAVLADWGATAEEIVEHYYRGTEVGPSPAGAARSDAVSGGEADAGDVGRDDGDDGAGRGDDDGGPEDPSPPGDGEGDGDGDERGEDGAEGPAIEPVRAGALEFGLEELTPGPALGPHSILPFDSPAVDWLEGPVAEAQFPFMALAASWRRSDVSEGAGAAAEADVGPDVGDRDEVGDEAGTQTGAGPGPGPASETAPPESETETGTGAGDARIMVRLSDDGIDWSAWTPLLPDEGDGRSPTEVPAGGDGESWTRMLIARGRFAQLRVALLAGQDGSTPEMERVTLHYVDADAGPLAPTPPPVEAAGDEAETMSVRSIEERVIRRSGWGADESLRFDADGDQIWPPFYTAPRAQIVHHTVTTNDPVDPAAIMRAVYHFHAVTRGWGDIGYNFLIDHRGNIYEGRFGGERDGRITQGGHAREFNSNSIGVALLGTFTASGAEPSDAAEAALVDMLAAKGVRYGIDPNAPVTLVSTRFPRAVMGHRDALPGHTACPGLGVHEQLDSIRARVAARMADLGPAPAPTSTPTPTRTPTPRPTRTLPPPSTAVPTVDPRASATPAPACVDVVQDGGFEASDPIWQRNRAWFTAWDVLRGARSMFVGLRTTDPDEATSYASVSQTVRLPAVVASATLGYSARTVGHDADRRLVRVFDEAGGTVALSGVTLPANSGWREWRHDVGAALGAHAGRRVRVYFGVVNNGDGQRSYLRLDDVALTVCGGVSPASTTAVPTSVPASPSPVPSPSPSPSPRPSSTTPPTSTPTPTATPTPTRVETSAPTAPPSTASPAPSASPTPSDTEPTPAEPTPTDAPTEPEPDPDPGPRPTALPYGCTDAVSDGGFEGEDFGAWRLEGDHPPSLVDAPGAAHGGRRAARLGRLEGAGFGYGAIAQRVPAVAGADSATLTFWLRVENLVEGDGLAVELRRPLDGRRRALLDDPPPAGDWHAISATLQPDERADGMEIYAAVLNRAASTAAEAGASSVQIDDVALVECREGLFHRLLPRLFGPADDPARP